MKKIFITIAILTLSISVGLMVRCYGQGSKPGISQEENLKSYALAPQAAPVVSIPDRSLIENKKQDESIAGEAETNLDHFSAWKEAIRNSRRGNDLLLAALFSANDEEREVVLHEAYSQDPKNVLLNYQILQFCLTVPISTLCSLPIVDTLLRHDGDNLHTLIVVSAFQYELGDVDSAFASLSSVQNAGGAEDYTIRYREALDESNRFHGYDRNFEILVSNIGIEAAIGVPHLVSIMSMCDKQIERGLTQWRYTCSTYGNALVEKGSSLFDQQMGLAIQRKYSGLSNEEIGSFRDPRKDKLDADMSTMNELAAQFGAEEFASKVISDEQWQSYLTTYRLEGEMAAIIYLVQVMEEQ